jgi:L-aminopeptidase/D-esterase-like protein
MQMSLSLLVSPLVPALSFAFPGLGVDIAEYSTGPTGITFFHFPERGYAAVDVRGGSPGTTFSDASRTACGNQRSENAIVPTAVVFGDKERDNDVRPDRALGLAALHSTREDWFPCGARGAGRFVHCGTYFGQACMEQSGQGAGFGEFGRTKRGVFTVVVNAVGVVVNRQGQPVLGNLDRQSGRRSLVAEHLRWGKKPHPTDLAAGAGVSENTTLTWLVTNRQRIRGRNCNAWRSLRTHRWHERSSHCTRKETGMLFSQSRQQKVQPVIRTYATCGCFGRTCLGCRAELCAETVC